MIELLVALKRTGTLFVLSVIPALCFILVKEPDKYQISVSIKSFQNKLLVVVLQWLQNFPFHWLNKQSLQLFRLKHH